jgi:hypothetical protein
MSTTPTPVTAAQVHHSWISILSQILRLSAVVAPAAAAPFVGAQDEDLIKTEAGIVSAIIGGAAKE